MTDYSRLWLAVGFFGQALFFSRFVVQWWASEKKKRSVIPVAFWYLSVLGSAAVLAYSIYRRDPVFILGNSVGLLVYVRNLWLIHHEPTTPLSDGV